jgi:hypothetical protein
MEENEVIRGEESSVEAEEVTRGSEFSMEAKEVTRGDESIGAVGLVGKAGSVKGLRLE